MGAVAGSYAGTDIFALERAYPDEIKYQLHVHLVEHGKCCKKCAKNNKPRREPIPFCPLTVDKK